MLSILLSVLMAQAAAAPQQTTRDARPAAAAGTAVIRGRVVDRANGDPVARVRVTASRQQGPMRSVLSGADGRFEIRELPAGSYYVGVQPDEFNARYLPAAFGLTAPYDPGGGKRPPRLSLSEGEVRERVDIALWRSLAIEGRVLDDRGEPLAYVRVVPVAADGGHFRGRVGMITSDDLGRFRLFGLLPGDYLVMAEIDRGPSGGPEAEAPVLRPVTTYYPSAVSESDAQVVRLSTEEITGVDIRVRRSRTFNISMTVVDSRGEPLTSNRGSVSLIRELRLGSTGYGLNSPAPGIFEAKNVTAGDYTISAQVNGPEGSGTPREYVHMPIRVDGDLEGLALSTSPAVAIKGEIVLDGTARPDLGTVRIATNPPRGWRGGVGSHIPVAVRPDLTFEIKDVFGPRIVMPGGLPRGWSVKEIRYGSEDVTDIPFEAKATAEPHTLRIAITNRGAAVRGRVVDDRGNAVPEAPVILFSTDPQRWRMEASTTGLTYTREDGTFEITGKRAGDYHIASPQDGGGFGGDLERTLKWLAPLAERITLTEEDRRAVDLRPVRRQ